VSESNHGAGPTSEEIANIPSGTPAHTSQKESLGVWGCRPPFAPRKKASLQLIAQRAASPRTSQKERLGVRGCRPLAPRKKACLSRLHRVSDHSGAIGIFLPYGYDRVLAKHLKIERCLLLMPCDTSTRKQGVSKTLHFY